MHFEHFIPTPISAHTHNQLSHHHTLTPSHPHTLTTSISHTNLRSQPSHHHTLTPSHPHTNQPSHHHTITPFHHYTLTPTNPHTITPSHHHTLTPSHCHTLTPSHTSISLKVIGRCFRISCSTILLGKETQSLTSQHPHPHTPSPLTPHPTYTPHLPLSPLTLTAHPHPSPPTLTLHCPPSPLTPLTPHPSPSWTHAAAMAPREEGLLEILPETTSSVAISWHWGRHRWTIYPLTPSPHHSLTPTLSIPHSQSHTKSVAIFGQWGESGQLTPSPPHQPLVLL